MYYLNVFLFYIGEEVMSEEDEPEEEEENQKREEKWIQNRNRDEEPPEEEQEEENQRNGKSAIAFVKTCLSLVHLLFTGGRQKTAGMRTGT